MSDFNIHVSKFRRPQEGTKMVGTVAKKSSLDGGTRAARQKVLANSPKTLQEIFDAVK